MMLSVIIPTRNRSKELKLAVESFEKQTLARHLFEIIIVDNGSTDDTQSVVANLAKNEKTKYFYEATPGLHSARHAGFREAASDILVYVDDDIEAFPTMLEAINKAFLDDNVALVGGKCLPKFESEPSQWLMRMWRPDAHGNRMLDALSLIDLGDQPKEINPEFVFGCNFSIRRRVLLEAQGFHPDGMPDQLIRYRGDGETYVANFIAAKGYKAKYVPLASVYHRVPSSRATIEYLCKRAFSQGISDSYTAIRSKYGVEFLRPSVTTAEPTTLTSRLRRLAEWFLRHGRKVLLFPVWKVSSKSTDVDKSYSNKIAAAYRRGYEFHQGAAITDETLHAWILRSNYWDCEIPLSFYNLSRDTESLRAAVE
jgi:glycosyltransferase involved in cell wall biosynthesis